MVSKMSAPGYLGKQRSNSNLNSRRPNSSATVARKAKNSAQVTGGTLINYDLTSVSNNKKTNSSLTGFGNTFGKRDNSVPANHISVLTKTTNC